MASVRCGGKDARHRQTTLSEYVTGRKPRGLTARQARFIASLRSELGLPRGPMPETARAGIAEIERLLIRAGKKPEAYVRRSSGRGRWRDEQPTRAKVNVRQASRAELDAIFRRGRG